MQELVQIQIAPTEAKIILLQQDHTTTLQVPAITVAEEHHQAAVHTVVDHTEVLAVEAVVDLLAVEAVEEDNHFAPFSKIKK